MSWNHRVLAHKDGDGWMFQIHEVYYENETPISFTKNGVTVGAESINGLKWTLEKMTDCLNKPILSADDFPKEWKEEED